MLILWNYFIMKQGILNKTKKILPYDIRIVLRRLNWKKQYFCQNFSSKSESKVTCPIEQKEYKNFIKLGDDLLSPSNGARSRQRVVWLYLVNELKILTKKLSILHVAPEYSYYNILSKLDNIDYTTGDKMVEGYSNQKGIMNVDLTELCFEDNSFDHIICNHILEHIPDDKKAMSEILRALKPGGTAILTVPLDETLPATNEDPSINTPEERKRVFGQWDHLRMYGLDIQHRLESVGSSVDMNRYAEKFSPEEYKKYGLCKEIVIVAKKNKD